MKTIYKYSVPVDDRTHEHLIPAPGEIVHVASQREASVEFWVRVNPEGLKVLRRFRVIGTGHPEPSLGTYLGTTLDGIFVWHLYEVE